MSAIEDWIMRANILESHIKSIQDRKLFHPPSFFLLRGESRKWDHPVTSKWSRRNISDEDEEREYYKRCFKGLYPEDNPFHSDINLRFVAYLQHHGFDTRLIDMTSKLDTALFFAVKEHPDEIGYIYKVYGYDILGLANDIDYADIESIFFSPNFPPVTHAITKVNPKPYLFYCDTNRYNLNAWRQKGWFIFQTKYYQGHAYNMRAYEVTPDEKKAINEEFEQNKVDSAFYFPNMNEIVKSVL